MEHKEPIETESMDQTIARRSGVGPNDLIAGWQSDDTKSQPFQEWLLQT